MKEGITLEEAFHVMEEEAKQFGAGTVTLTTWNEEFEYTIKVRRKTKKQ